MSKKVSHRASITNRPTCGGPRKAGLAPRSTNFMMGVKRNHHFRGTPFAGKAADYPDKCRGESSGGGSSSGNGLTLGSGSSSCNKCCEKLSNTFALVDDWKCEKNVCKLYFAGRVLEKLTEEDWLTQCA